MKSNVSSVLRQFSGEVANSRSTFYKRLQDLPTALRDTTVKSYEERITRANGNPLLGEYAPWLVADLLCIRNRSAIDTVVPSWMNLYAYTLFLDDILDVRDKSDSIPLLMASQIILQRGLSDLYLALPVTGDIRIQIDKFALEIASAVMGELQRHRGQFRNYTDEDVTRLGEKVSLLKICASCILVADGQQYVQESLLLPVDLLSTGMQLFDDIMDWEEDWRSGNYTYLLTQTASSLHGLGRENPLNTDLCTAMEVLTTMVISGSLEDCLDKGLSYLKRVIATPGLDHSSTTYHLLRVLTNENHVLLQEISTARQEFTKHRAEYLRDGGNDWLRNLTANESVQRQIEVIDQKLRIVAQGC